MRVAFNHKLHLIKLQFHIPAGRNRSETDADNFIYLVWGCGSFPRSGPSAQPRD